MLAIPHMITGAAVGKATRRAWIALPAALVSHLILDVVPHLDSHGLFGMKSGPTLGEGIAALTDLLLGIALVVWAVGRQPGRRLMFVAAFFGIVIDLVDNVPPWNVWFHRLPGMASFSSFHHGIQHNVTRADWPLGFGTQLVTVVIAVWIVRYWRRKKRAVPELAGKPASTV